MKILAIETSADETAAAVTQGTKILSSVRWSQEVHAQWGGIVPALAMRAHEERINQIINEALERSETSVQRLGAIAVTVGPGLAIALEVGIKWAKKLALEWHKPLIGVNHIEGHILSSLANSNLKLKSQNSKSQLKIENLNFPCLALVVSGGHTELIRVEKIGDYKILARTMDDSLGEALDKAARMLGLPYPGGAALEKVAEKGDPKKYQLPLPMLGREDKDQFSYSGLKTAMYRLVTLMHDISINDLAATFQDRAFAHLTRVLEKSLLKYQGDMKDLLVGGGVSQNRELRRRLEELGERTGLRVWFADRELCGDNAAMIGIAASFRAAKGEFDDPDRIDRLPRWRVDEEN